MSCSYKSIELYKHFTPLVIILMLLGSVQHARAEQECDDCNSISFKGIVYSEGFILLGAYGGSRWPAYFGTCWLVLSPMMTSDKLSDSANMTMVATSAAVGAYDISISLKDEYDAKEVMKNNFIGFNAGMLIAMILNHFTNPTVSGNNNVAVNFVSKKDELSLLFSIPL